MEGPNLRPVFIKVTIYHLVILILLVILLTRDSGISELFPIGAGHRLFASPGIGQSFEPIHSGRLEGQTTIARAFFLMLCFLCSIAVSVPVAWTYLGTRSAKKRDSSFAQAILLLPIAVTGLVLIVQYSLALAFALAGVVAGAGIRYRTNIKDVTDTLFFLIAIGIGVASGVGSLGMAVMMSIVFTITLLVVTAIDFGSEKQSSASTTSRPSEQQKGTATDH